MTVLGQADAYGRIDTVVSPNHYHRNAIPNTWHIAPVYHSAKEFAMTAKSKQSTDPRPEPPSLTPPKYEPIELYIDNLELEVPEGETVAQSWTGAWSPDDDYAPPEFYAHDWNGRRVQGIRAETRYDAWLWQLVAVQPSLALTFTMDFQVDPSEANRGRAKPSGLVVGVGIDPTGNVEAQADTVHWALRDLKYSQMVTASVTAIAQADKATVFVRSIAFVPGSSTFAAGGSGGLCQMVCARAVYPRTYVLLPPNTPQAIWERAARAAQRNNWTLGGSADDAGLGTSLLSPQPTVIAVNALSWSNPQEPMGITANWFAQNYPPGVNFQARLDTELDLL